MAEINEAILLRPAGTLLQARSLAILGASPKGRWASVIFQNLKRSGYRGKVFLINPNYEELWAAPCYPTLSAIPEPAEHLLVIIPTRAVLPALEEAARLGVKSATIYSANFGEGTDAEGKDRAQALKEFCDRTGVVCCGPNCMGTISVDEGLWTFPANFPLLKPGPVGLIFQSGGSLGSWVKAATERGIGFSYAISSGNETNLDLADYANFMLEEPKTKMILMMVEGVRRPAAFMHVAAKALGKNKPILLVKIGRTEAAKRQAISHTGALAGSDEVFNAMCHRLGIVRCPSLEDLLETTLAFLPGKVPRGGRLAIVINSGGMKGVLLDHLEEVGVEMAELSQATKVAVRPLIPTELAVENPLECGVAGFGDDKTFLDICRLHAEDDGVDMLAINGELPRHGEKRDPTRFRPLVDSVAKPVFAIGRTTYSLTDESRAYQEQSGLPFLQGIRATLRAAKGLGLFATRRADGIPPLPPAVGKAEDLAGTRFQSLLETHDLKLPRQALAHSAVEAVAKAEEIGYPVALKLVSTDVIHKTEAGAVVLGLRSAGDIEQRGSELLGNVSNGQLLVQEMVEGTEVIVGARTDPQYGPLIMVGLGGIFVEVLKDISLRLIPVNEKEAVGMLRELRAYKILEGARGQERRDIGALVRAIVGLASLFAAYRNHLTDLEINPLIVRQEGRGAVAVDVRMIRNS
ncbi:MAG TPA: acetate--CoA ligase family protein [Methylomirabilota bacterium]|nr:acetate--CoA ligase family protein [Methylomirabilota bacterium]